MPVWGMGHHLVIECSLLTPVRVCLRERSTMHKLSLLVSCPLRALYLSRATSSLWFKTCRLIFRPLVSQCTPPVTRCCHNLCLCLFRLTCCWPCVALCPWNQMRCLPSPSLFHSEEYFLSVLSRLAVIGRMAFNRAVIRESILWMFASPNHIECGSVSGLSEQRITASNKVHKATAIGS